MIQQQRRAVKLHERTVPCLCCNYPITQRHHLLPFAIYGENGMTVQLCANCHELYHLIENWTRESAKSVRKAIQMINGKTETQQMYNYIQSHVNHNILKFMCELVNIGNELRGAFQPGQGTVAQQRYRAINQGHPEGGKIIDAINRFDGFIYRFWE